MKNLSRHILRFSVILAIVFGTASLASGQPLGGEEGGGAIYTVTGLPNVDVNSVHTYTMNGPNIQSIAWDNPPINGTIISTSGNTVTIGWNQVGTGYIGGLVTDTGSGQHMVIDLAVTINAVPPAAPPTGALSALDYCGYSTLSHNPPPSGVTWYWQTTAADISTSYPNTYTANSTGTYYLRAKQGSLWSSATSIYVTVDAVPAAPPVPTISLQCGNTVLTRANAPSGITYYWQSSSTGTETSNSLNTTNRPSAGTYYLRARNDASACWSATATAVTYGFNTVPAMPATPSIALNCGSTVLTKPAAPGGITYYWQSSTTGMDTSTAAAAATSTKGSAGTYYLRAKNNTTNCWGPARTFSYGFNSEPAIPTAPSITLNCGSTVLTKPSAPNGITYYWQSSTTGMSTDATAQAYTSTKTSGGTSYLRAKNNTTNCWGPALTFSYGFNALPPMPSLPTIALNCGNTVLTKPSAPSSITYYWQSSPTGISTTGTADDATLTMGSAGTYHLRARNNTTNCWGPARTFSYGFNAEPAMPAIPTITLNCGNTVLTKPSAPGGITFYWQSSTTGMDTSTAAAAATSTKGSAGTYYLRAKNNTTNCWGPARTFNYGFSAVPAMPATPSIALNCGNTVLTKPSAPGGITYYWQSTASGTSTSGSAGDALLSMNSGGTHHLRAYNTSTQCWGPARTFSYGFNAEPAMPATPSIALNCGNTVLTKPSAPGGITYYWQSSTTGIDTSTAAAAATSTKGSAGTYYLRAKNNTTNCWGPARTFSYGFNAEPMMPATPSIALNCGNTVLTKPSASGGITYYWQSSPTGISTTGTSDDATLSMNGPGTYYLRAKNNTTHCWGPARTFSYGFNALPPMPATPSITLNCGNTVLTKPSAPGGITYYWQSSTTGIDTSTAAAAATSTKGSGGTYYLRAKNNTTNCWGPARTFSYGFSAVPAMPATPSIALNCGNTVLTKPSAPGGITYYWQSTATGTSTSGSAGDASLSMNSGGTQHLRAYNTSTQCWGPARTFSYGFSAEPAMPATPSIVLNCGNTVLTKPSAPGGITYYWQTSASGTSTSGLAGDATLTMYSGGTHHLRAYNTSTSCWGPARTFSYGLEGGAPAAPLSPVVTKSFGSSELTRLEPPTNVTWYWQGTNPNGTSTSDYASSYTTSSAGTYYLRSRSSAGCWGPSVAATVTITSAPQITANGGTSLSSLGDQVTLNAGTSYSSYTWKRNGVTIGTGASFTASQAGTYTLSATQSGVTGTGASNTISVTGSGNGASEDQNYVISNSILVNGITSEAQVSTLNSDQRNVNVQYMDGLGRAKYAVGIEAAPDKRHIVSPVVYDGYGRQSRSYLPYVTNDLAVYGSDPLGIQSSSYSTSTQYQFYQSTNDVAHDTKPFSEMVYDNSPLGRVLKQGAQGSTWQPVEGSTTDKVVRMEYDVPLENELRNYSFKDGIPVPNEDIDYSGTVILNPGNVGNPQTELRSSINKNIVEDEEGNQVISYLDRAGRTLLKKVETGDTSSPWAETYYVYDHKGNLSVVLPPEAMNAITTGNLDDVPDGYDLINSDVEITATTYNNGSYMYTDNGSVTLLPGVTLDPGAEIVPYEITYSLLDQWAFQYQYDGLNRMIAKRVPGAGWVYMVYDNLDRLVLAQDANQRATGQWSFTKYDIFGRPVLTGLYTNTGDREAVQNTVNGQSVYYESPGSVVLGYTNNAFPQVSTANDYLTASYYDDYSNLTSDFTFSYLQELGNGLNNGNVKRQVVGSKTKLLDGSNTWLKSIVYYDDRYRVLQAVSDNHLGGSDRVTNTYDFVGRVLETKTTHDEGTPAADITIAQSFDYDHASRLMEVSHQVNSDPEVILVKNEYNALGQVIDKKLHSADNGVNFEQSVDFQYNIRGWLESINDAALSDGEGDYFGMELAYNNALSGVNNSALFNGNISAAKWSNMSRGDMQSAYAFDYDDMNRLTAADYSEKQTGWNNTTKFDVNALAYDLNGNIESLRRYATNTSLALDHLAYSYVGNQLQAVTDNGDGSNGFKDGNTSGNDYNYDANGNMISDANKDITGITYNHLNLPLTITFTGGRTIAYQYDAAGIKLAKIIDDNGTITTTDYSSGFIYEQGVLQQIAHAEGRVRRKATGDMVYDYYLKDHLGNTRVTFSADKPVVPYRATMEGELAVSEESYFLNIANLREINVLANKTGSNGGVNGNEVVRLNGIDPNKRLGPGKMIEVMAGDKVDMEVYGYYTGSPGSNSPIPDLAFAALVGNAFGGSSTGNELEQSIQNGFENSLAQVVPSYGSGDNTDIKAYLNYVLFNADFDPVQSGFVRVDQGAVDGNHRLLQLNDVTLNHSGFLYVYVSNEGNVDFNVYFDELEITHTSGGVLQEDHYYPFGMNINALSSTAPLSKPNQFKYNGFELQSDFDLEWYDYGARMYSPAIGRWNSIDPYADIYEFDNPYNYALNNPINVIDPDGRLVVYVNGFRQKAYVRWFKRQLWSPVKTSEPHEWHSSNWYQEDQYGYWSEFNEDWNFRTSANEQDFYVDGSNSGLSNGDWRMAKGEKEGKVLAEKIKSGEIKLEEGELIKLVGHSMGAAHAVGMAQGLLEAGVDPSIIKVFLFAPHQPNQISGLDGVEIFQVGRDGDKVSSTGILAAVTNSKHRRIPGSDWVVAPDRPEEERGGHYIETFTTDEFKKAAPKLFQYLIDAGYINPDGSFKDNDNE